MSNKALVTAVYLCLIIMGGGAALVAYWLWWPVTPFVSLVGDGPRKILNPGGIVHPGDVILFKGWGEHFTDGVLVEVTAQLQNSFLLSLPTNKFVTTRGVFGPITVARYRVPEFAPPGPYRLVLESVYHLNPLRNWVFVSETETFTVAPRPELAPGPMPPA